MTSPPPSSPPCACGHSEASHTFIGCGISNCICFSYTPRARQTSQPSLLKLAAITAVTALSVVALGACSSVQEGYEDGYSQSSTPSLDSHEVGLTALAITWDDMSSDDQQALCDGYVIIPEEIIDTVYEGNEDYLTREDIRTFLDEEC